MEADKNIMPDYRNQRVVKTVDFLKKVFTLPSTPIAPSEYPKHPERQGSGEQLVLWIHGSPEQIQAEKDVDRVFYGE